MQKRKRKYSTPDCILSNLCASMYLPLKVIYGAIINCMSQKKGRVKTQNEGNKKMVGQENSNYTTLKTQQTRHFKLE